MNIGGNDSPMRRPLELAIAGMTDTSDIVDAVLKCLSNHRLINYRGDAVPLLTSNGRILFDLMKNPQATLREVSVRLGTTQNNVSKQMTNLVRAGLVQRTNLGASNRYKIDLEMVLSHPDISALLDAVISASDKDVDAGSDSALSEG